MSEKMTCPGCDSHTSAVLNAYESDGECPYCGLSAEAMYMVTKAKERHASDELITKYTESQKENRRLVKENAMMRLKLNSIEQAVSRKLEDFGSAW